MDPTPQNPNPEYPNLSRGNRSDPESPPPGPDIEPQKKVPDAIGGSAMALASYGADFGSPCLTAACR
jgi:hypothetical protein